MKTILSFGVVLATTLSVSSSALAQGEAAVPFLLISSSVEGNGMGGISAAVSTDNAMSVIANPAQLGFLSMKNFVTAGTYLEKSRWRPQWPSSPTYNASAINVGLDLTRVTRLPFPVSIGLGYSRVFSDLGEIIIADPGSPDGMSRFDPTEKSESFSVGVGVDYLIRGGIGFNFKSIESRLVPPNVLVKPGAGKGKASGVDYGVMVQAPVFQMISGAGGDPLELFPDVEPLLDITTGYAKSNVGDEISYVDPAQRDPLPRNATLGLSVEMGVVSKALSSDWKILSLTWARQVEDLLVKRYPDGHFEYQGWFGNIKPFDNLILGKWGGNVDLRKGWQFEVGEILSVRGGSFTGTGLLMYKTSGYSIRLSGFLKLLEAANRSIVSGTWLGFVRDHVDLQYHSSNYGESTSPASGTSFKGINLVIK